MNSNWVTLESRFFSGADDFCCCHINLHPTKFAYQLWDVKHFPRNFTLFPRINFNWIMASVQMKDFKFNVFCKIPSIQWILINSRRNKNADRRIGKILFHSIIGHCEIQQFFNQQVFDFRFIFYSFSIEFCGCADFYDSAMKILKTKISRFMVEGNKNWKCTDDWDEGDK